MSREWKPGDVAMVDGHVALVWDEDDDWPKKSPLSFVYTDNDGVPCSIYVHDRARPLVVIDPEGFGDLIELVQEMRIHRPGENVTLTAQALQTALRQRLNPKPPRPDEPTGLGAVVRATCGCDGPSQFVHEPQSDRFENRPGGKGRPWKSRCGHHVWSDLTDVEVLSEGVKP